MNFHRLDVVYRFLCRIRGVFKQVFEQRVDLRRKCLELESGARGLDYRIRHKERRLARVAMLHLEPHLGREVGVVHGFSTQ